MKCIYLIYPSKFEHEYQNSNLKLPSETERQHNINKRDIFVICVERTSTTSFAIYLYVKIHLISTDILLHSSYYSICKDKLLDSISQFSLASYLNLYESVYDIWETNYSYILHVVLRFILYNVHTISYYAHVSE